MTEQKHESEVSQTEQKTTSRVYFRTEDERDDNTFLSMLAAIEAARKEDGSLTLSRTATDCLIDWMQTATRQRRSLIEKIKAMVERAGR